MGGLLAFESEWTPPLGEPLIRALERPDSSDGRLDLGCVAAHGIFGCDAAARETCDGISVRAHRATAKHRNGADD